MWQSSHLRKFTVFAVICGAIVLARPGSAAAQQTDPVEDLRQALPIRLADAESTQIAIDFRRATLQKKVDALKTIGDLRRALLLDVWNQDPDRTIGEKPPVIDKLKEDPDRTIGDKLREIDIEMRRLVGQRLIQSIKKAVKTGDATSRIAIANLIAEMGPTLPSINPGERTGFTRLLTPEVIQLTQDEDIGVRQEALRALGSIYPKPADAVPVFAMALAKESPGPKRVAADGLGQMIRVASFLRKRTTTTTGVKVYPSDVFQTVFDVIQVLGPGLKAVDPQVRSLTLQALQVAGQSVADLVSDPISKKDLPLEGRPLTEAEAKRIMGLHADVQSELQAVNKLTRALGNYADDLASALEDPDINVRLAASIALENLGSVRVRLKRLVYGVPVVPGGEGDGDMGNRTFLRESDALRDFIKNRLGAITKLLNDPDVRLRRSAIDFLDLIEDSAIPALPLIAESLLDPDRFVRWAAARALGNIAPDKAAVAVPNLAKLLSDSDLNVRMAAALTLETMGPLAKDAAPALAQATTVGDVEGRVAAMYALQRIGPDNAKVAVPQLAEGLNHDDPRTRRVAAQTLGIIGPNARAALPALRRSLGDDDQDVRVNSSDAILSIQR